ncbi:MAG: RecQ family ATP-dependent DNA helicase [Myxococcota bacterium]
MSRAITQPTLSSAGDADQASLREILRRRFGHDAFRAHQEPICEAITAGDDALVVMPTGAGKSLCYQLPALARGGTALVVSPLIALMDDQVAHLAAHGLRAERIHSARSRDHALTVMHAYAAGELDFLFVAPERLASTRFVEELGRRTPALVAIDEAHCVSHWGHDFRPDYRLLRDRLTPLRPAPFVALTATATGRVQRDVLQQLGMKDARRFVHGFRRDNLDIECVPLSRPERPEVVVALLDDAARLPAIVYAPSRKETESLATLLSSRVRAGAYHAGMTPTARERVQSEFLAGTLDVIVATIAFGMGIDKANIRTVVHTALPGSIEGYYQEIGRAGRDGERALALLLYSFGDRKTQEWLHEKSYPPTRLLERVHGALVAEACEAEALRGKLGLEAALFSTVVDKLRIHGGAIIERDGSVRRAEGKWKKSYDEQCPHHLDQIEQVARYAERRTCRMRQLVTHFDDREDHGRACGHCDACSPKGTRALASRPLTRDEAQLVKRVLGGIDERRGTAIGRLHRESCERDLSRTELEALLASLEHHGLVTVEETSFETEGRTVNYRNVLVTRAGKKLTRERDLEKICASVAVTDVAARRA